MLFTAFTDDLKLVTDVVLLDRATVDLQTEVNKVVQKSKMSKGISLFQLQIVLSFRGNAICR